MGFIGRKKVWITSAVLFVAAVVAGLLFVFDVFGKKEPKEPEELTLKDYPEEYVLPEVPDGSVLIVKQVTKVRVLSDGTKIPLELSEYDDTGCLLRYDIYSVGGKKTESYAYTYNERRQVMSVTYENLQERWNAYRKLQYDEAGRVIETEFKNLEDTAGFPSLELGSGQEEYRYDASGNLISYQIYYPERNTRDRTVYTYDENGNILTSVTTHMDGSFSESRYEYDDNGVLRKITLTVSFGDDYSYSDMNEYQSVSWYDETGRLYLQQHFNNKELYMETDYDGEGRILETRRNEDGKIYVSVRNEYDSDNHLIRSIDLNSRGEILFAYQNEYDSKGNIIEYSFFDTSAKKMVLFSKMEYQYDEFGNMTCRKAWHQHPDSDGEMFLYNETGYDASGRETYMQYMDWEGNNTYSETYFYDAFGNVIRKIIHGDLSDEGESLPDYEIQYRYLAFAVPVELLSDSERGELMHQAQSEIAP